MGRGTCMCRCWVNAVHTGGWTIVSIFPFRDRISLCFVRVRYIRLSFVFLSSWAGVSLKIDLETGTRRGCAIIPVIRVIKSAHYSLVYNSCIYYVIHSCWYCSGSLLRVKT